MAKRSLGNAFGADISMPALSESGDPTTASEMCADMDLRAVLHGTDTSHTFTKLSVSRIDALCKIGQHHPQLLSHALLAEVMMVCAADQVLKDRQSLLRDMQDVLRDSDHKQLSQVAHKVACVLRMMIGRHATSLHTMSTFKHFNVVGTACTVICDKLMTEDLARSFAINACRDSTAFLMIATEHYFDHQTMRGEEYSSTKIASAAAHVASLITLDQGAKEAVQDWCHSIVNGTDEHSVRDEVRNCSAWSSSSLAYVNEATNVENSFKGPNTNCPESPPKRIRVFTLHEAASPQQRGGTATDEDLPFLHADLEEATRDYYIAKMNTAFVRGFPGATKAAYMAKLGTCAAEYFANYVNGMTHSKTRRSVSDVCNAPRCDEVFRFVINHVAIDNVQFATQGEEMFEPFNVEKRLQAVQAYFKCTLDKMGDRRLAPEAIANFVPGKLPRAVFVNVITSVLLCTGVEFSGFGVDATFVVVDFVRAMYRSRSRLQVPGNGLCSIRKNTIYIVSCSSSMRTTLKALMDELSEENHALNSPELLLEHSLLKSTLVVSAGRPCSLKTLNAGIRTALSSMQERQCTTIDDRRTSNTNADLFMDSFTADATSIVSNTTRQFVFTHGDPACIHGTHTALKTYMQYQSSSTGLKRDEIKKDDVSSIAPNAHMFSHCAILVADSLFKQMREYDVSQLATSAAPMPIDHELFGQIST